jgi:hypothetical protein
MYNTEFFLYFISHYYFVLILKLTIYYFILIWLAFTHINYFLLFKQIFDNCDAFEVDFL